MTQGEKCAPPTSSRAGAASASTKADLIRGLAAGGMSQAAICRLLGIKNKSQAARAVRGTNPSAKPAPAARPGWPKMLPCLGDCGVKRRATWAGDRMCEGCRKEYSGAIFACDSEANGA